MDLQLLAPCLAWIKSVVLPNPKGLSESSAKGTDSASRLRAHIKMRNGRVARDLAVLQGARSGEYPLWIFDRRATQQQRQRSATRRAVFWRAPGGVAPQSESAAAIFLRRALPAARQKTARPFLILIWALTTFRACFGCAVPLYYRQIEG